MTVDLRGYYTVREVCKLTTLSRQTIWRMVEDGRFPPPVELTEGRGRIGFSIPAVHRWLADKAARPHEKPDEERP
ncbi:helix-turn-helix transcriptional regulator [Rhizobium sp. LjRoot254]|uniref:helix-turn-helix transcriptional regulator n=1 Tax=Rhizobium sp. LjRoot254 TaxID=3342297 RepID=UPI003ECD234F